MTCDPIAHFQSRRPRCLAGFRAAKGDAPPFELDGHGEPINTFFLVHCLTCGGSQHSVRGYRETIEWQGRPLELFLSPLETHCRACGSSTPLFDAELHGHDAEFGLGGSSLHGKGTRDQFRCSCGSEGAFVLTTRFEYPADLVAEGDQVDGKAVEDLFTWFTLLGTCASCHDVMQIAEFECA